MSIIMVFFLFLFGLCVGSFLNVLIYRLPRNLSPFKGRSFCDRCEHQLAWKDNIPLLSFILLKGKCRYCQKPISWQYPLVELVTAIVTLTVFLWPYGLLGGVLYHLLITYALIVIFFADLKYHIIPDEIIFPAILVSLLTNFFQVEKILANLLAGLGAFSFFLFLVLITKGKGMGGGDLKLSFLMGLFLGWPKIVVAFYFAFLTGAILGVILVLIGKKRFGEHIPFGPFLVSGTFFALFFGEKAIEAFLKFSLIS